MLVTDVQLKFSKLSFCRNTKAGFVGQVNSIPLWAKPTLVNNTGTTNGLTVTVNEQLVLSPQLSLAVLNTVLVPIGKVLPLGGAEMTVGALQPPLAAQVKNTAMPFELVAVAVRFEEQVSTIGDGRLVTSPTVPGVITDGDQVLPPSKLTSVKISKKLLMR